MSSLTVLIPVDGSENSQKAFDWYIKYFHQENNNIIVYHSYEPPNVSAFSIKSGISGIPVEDWQEVISKNVKEVKQLEDNYTAKCHGLGVKHKVVSERLDNKPGEAICKFAKNHNVDMIVMGTRGLGTVRRTILGSVSDYVLHHSHCPVSVIPSKDEDKK